MASRLASGRWTRLCIISPHLDDAAFSAFALLQEGSCEHHCVVSVITEPGVSGGAQWARAAGFADPVAEFRARQEEDRHALGTLGVTTRHLGVSTGSSTGQIEAGIRGFLGSEANHIETTLYLLPAGAGGQKQRSGIPLWIARILRRPLGATAHPEHVTVRNALVDALRMYRHASFGFYGEQPYVWNDSVHRLCGELEQLSGRRLEPIREWPDLDSKLGLARMYGSQFRLIFGDSPWFQRRVMRRAEEYYLPRA